MISYSIVFLTLLSFLHSISLPCASNCDTCSSATQCITCASQYYASSINGILQCLPCGQFCLTCQTSTNCNICISPYVLQADGSCQQCQISNAAKCSLTVAASQCKSGYYVSNNYCYNCLLNCADCSSNTDCKSCVSGYYLNSSILTCNLCVTNCLSCDQYNSTRCTSCVDGYTLSAGFTCDNITCTIDNCLYCSSVSVCLQCKNGYYWDSGQSSCVLGASVLCTFGAQGPYPNQCNRKCSQYQYLAKQNVTALWCLPYLNIGINSSTFSQVYLYAYNNQAYLAQLLSTSKSLRLEQNGQYSYPIDSGNKLKISILYSYYKITIFIKYCSAQPTNLILSATTQSTTQYQSKTLPTRTSVSMQQLTTVYLHSNNLQIQFNNSIYLVQLLIRTLNCPTDCYRCLNEQLCQMCMVPQYVSAYKCVDNCTIYYHFVINRTCLTSCPDLFYPSNLGVNNKFCQTCVAPCAKCVSPTNCLSCVAGKYLFNFACINTCPNGYFGDSLGYCAPCISPCGLCINQTTCLTCKQGYWNSVQALCTIKCPTGYYGNDTTKNCQICQTPCLTCINTLTKCLTCIPDRYYQDYKCLSQCPQRYYPIISNLTCMPCVLPCLTCLSSSVCLSCSYDFLYNNTCIGICPTRYFANLANKKCQSCSSGCKTCVMLGQCTSCLVGSCFVQGACVTSCPVNLYYALTVYRNTTNQQCTCQECPYPCKECLPSSQCTSCLRGFLLATTHQCLNICPIGYFANNLTYQCTNCTTKYSIYCLQCNNTSCFRCSSNYLLYNGICISQCPAQHYQSLRFCQKCIAPCLECISFIQCISCISPYLFSNGSCIIQCPFGKVSFLNTIQNLRICISCQYPCANCQNSSPTNCSICTFGYFLYLPNNTCMSQCSVIIPLNSFYDQLITSTCSKCMFPCKTCSSQTTCLTCQIGFLTAYDKCQYCRFGTFANQTTGTCDLCPLQCSNCYSKNYCTGCNIGFYLYGSNCISDTTICISNGYYPIGRVCSPCQMPCLLCSQTSTTCLSCVTGYIFYPPNQCITQCPQGTFRNGSVCSLCHFYCQRCSGTSTYCFSCKTSYLMVTSQMNCVITCPNGTFLLSSTCQLCQYPCLQCISRKQCTSCLSGTLVNTTCLSSCTSGYYSDVNMLCQPCNLPCSQCQISPTLCKQCISGYFLFNNSCLNSCPTFYFGQYEAHLCLQCLGLCNECTSQINCTNCKPNMLYYYNENKNYGQCVNQCPNGFYNTSVLTKNLSQNICKTCLITCLTCENNTSCILCKNNSAQYLGQCFSQCPAQMYSKNGICQNCEAPCFNCTDAYTCTACMNNSFLLVGSAECIVGQICPFGFYLIPGTRNCNGQCPLNYYYRNDRTCNNQGCDIDQYKGVDMHCYSQCPNGYKSDQNYNCKACSGDQCYNGLFYNIKPIIIRDQLLLQLIFTQDPIYKVSQPKIILNPSFNQKIITLQTQRLLQQNQNTKLASINQKRNITIQLYPESSFSQTTLTLTFQSALATFANPIQRISTTIILPGFDIYPSTSQISLGIVLLACAIIGLVKNPYMTDFAQLIYLMAFFNLHYPNNLASILESGAMAHLHGFIQILQYNAAGKGKFSYIADMGLLSNSAINLIVIAAGLIIFLILFLIYNILKKIVSYSKVDQYPNQQHQDPKSQKQQPKQQQNQPLSKTKNNQKDQNQPQKNSNKTQQLQFLNDGRITAKIFRCLHNNFITHFKMGYLNRLVYFNYMPITLFTISQLFNLDFSNDSFTDFVSSILCFVMLIGLLVFAWRIFAGGKQKYAFLMIRKIVLSLAVVLSVQNPAYVIGVCAIGSIMAAILIGAYGMQKWKVQTKFNVSMQIIQSILMILYAIFAIIGQGSYTTIRLYLSWIIICFIIAICLSYLIFSIFFFVLWGCKKFNNIDYIQQWANKGTQHQSQLNSQLNNNDVIHKQHELSTQQQKTITIQKLLSNINLNKQLAKQDTQYNENISNNNNKKGGGQIKITNNKLFWTYNDNDNESNKQQKQRQQKAPRMLIRCVHQFSDFDNKQKEERQKQMEQEQVQYMQKKQNIDNIIQSYSNTNQDYNHKQE